MIKSDNGKNAIEEIDKSIDNSAQMENSESQINRERFRSALISTIDVRFAEIMASKKGSEAYLTYIDAQILTTKVRGIFINALNTIPPQVENACQLSEKILSPSAKEKVNRIKAAIGITGGAVGLGIIVASIASALNWWKSPLHKTLDALKGAPHYGAIFCGVLGLLLLAVAGYYSTRNNHQTDTERFLLVLKSSAANAVDAIWPQFEEALSVSVNTGQGASQKN